ncbi:nicotinamide riboside kinase 1 [Ophiostoma piceae UAMH 11346]|uniref:Nicotinamide riboside kinase 1 n=1 Tax=Ophiostoma piceae (strain UAMH 11346) TaxID=1262450 RepID=S3C789_OPHP1|nr:nicotinamide riboside kinase 1 [Ophiostoma piceae UAMH 11346]
MASVDRKAVIVGISGCSSSGKTTLARLLRDIFPNTFILHEDDFYKQDDQIPIGADGLADWDCAGAIALPDMEQALAYIRTKGASPVSRGSLSQRADHGTARRKRRPVSRSSPSISAAASSASPTATSIMNTTLTNTQQPNLFSKEDQNSVGKCPVPDETIEALKAKVKAWLEPGHAGHKLVAAQDAASAALKICIFDGFLLYCEATRAAMDQIDVRLFLRVSHAKATQRREARDGYVTLDGFWQDPPGYVDKIVWPNYVEAHKWLFTGGDVEGTPDKAVLDTNSILTQTDQGVDVDMATTLEWAVTTLMRELEDKYL